MKGHRAEARILLANAVLLTPGAWAGGLRTRLCQQKQANPPPALV